MFYGILSIPSDIVMDMNDVMFMTLYSYIFRMNLFNYFIVECSLYHKNLVMPQCEDFQYYANNTYPCQRAVLRLLLYILLDNYLP